MPAPMNPLPDADEAMPLYRRIYLDLQRKINAGQIANGEQLPILPDLCRRYGVSEAPVRRALDDLSREGYVVKRRGRGQGTFAIRPTVAPLTVRVLLIADFDLSRSPIEGYHEIFDILAGIRDAAAERGGAVQQVSTGGWTSLSSPNSTTGYLVIAMNAEGYDKGAALAQSHGAPCVLLNTPGPGAATVRVDMEQGGVLAADYLIGLGHRRIGYVGGMHGAWSAPRFAGYQRALYQHNIAPDARYAVLTNGVDTDADTRALNDLLALPDPPTAIFASSDYRALHLLTHARSRGLQVPRDFSLCGYDDIAEAATIEPPLTTVHHPRYGLGRRAVGLLADLLGGSTPKGGTDIVLAPSLAVRASCAPPR